jgi:hypothetical protein
VIAGAGVRSVVVAAGCLALWASPATADPADEVMVRTRVMVATNSGPARGIDKELRQLAVAASLQRFPYASFRLLQSEERPVEFNGWAEFPVPGGRHLLVRPTEFRQGRVALSVMLMQGRMTLMNTVLRLRNHGEFVVAGPQQGDGVLFLSIGAAVPASPCR